MTALQYHILLSLRFFSPQPTNLAEGYCYPPFRPSVRLSVRMSVRLSVCPSVRPSVRLLTFEMQ